MLYILRDFWGCGERHTVGTATGGARRNRRSDRFVNSEVYKVESSVQVVIQNGRWATGNGISNNATN